MNREHLVEDARRRKTAEQAHEGFDELRSEGRGGSWDKASRALWPTRLALAAGLTEDDVLTTLQELARAFGRAGEARAFARRTVTEARRAPAELAALSAEELAALGQPMARRRRPARTRRREPARPPPEELARPPWAELAPLMRSCVPVAEDLDVSTWLRSRGIPPELIGERTPAHALPRSGRLPRWAGSRLGDWRTGGYRLLLPTYDYLGQVRSVIARRITRRIGDDAPKALPPTGFKRKALVLANRAGVRALRAGACSDPVVVVEGEPDWLTVAVALPDWPVFGIAPGAWHAAFASRLRGAPMWIVATDEGHEGDRYAGDRYAADVRATIPVGVDVIRSCPPNLYRARGVDVDGRPDWNDALQAGLIDLNHDSVIDALHDSDGPFLEIPKP